MTDHRQSFLVHGYEVDAFDQLTIPALGGFLQEAASNNVRALRCSIDELRPKGLTWVLLRLRLEIAGPIREGDRLEVHTWPSGRDRLAVQREYQVTRGDGDVVVRADSLWLVLDIESRRPVRLETVIDPQLLESGEHLLSSPRERLSELERWDEERRFELRYQDIDFNLHANNTAYLSWLMEAVPRATWRSSRLAECDVQYLAECHLGSSIASRALVDEDGSIRHAVVRAEDGRELARARTRWVPRGG